MYEAMGIGFQQRDATRTYSNTWVIATVKEPVISTRNSKYTRNPQHGGREQAADLSEVGWIGGTPKLRSSPGPQNYIYAREGPKAVKTETS